MKLAEEDVQHRSADLRPMRSDEALKQARAVLRWYQRHTPRERWKAHAAEIVLLIVSSLVTVTGVLMPNDARVPAILGAVSVFATGIASIFRWRENWARFCFASNSLNVEIRLYESHAAPYDHPDTRDMQLIKAINGIELKAYHEWAKNELDSTQGRASS